MIFANMRTLNAFRLKWASKASNPFESNQERTDCDFIFSGFIYYKCLRRIFFFAKCKEIIGL